MAMTSAAHWVRTCIGSGIVIAVAGCGPTTFRVPPDDGPWIGLAETPRSRTFLHSAALADSGAVVTMVLRSVAPYGRGGNLEVHTTAQVDCERRLALVIRRVTMRPDGEHRVGFTANERHKPFGEHGESLPLAQACIRLGRSPGRLAPD